MRSRLKVAHVDHSVEVGGAELALQRLVRAESGWTPVVFVPRGLSGLGVFSGLADVEIHQVGPTHPPRKSLSTKLPGLGPMALAIRVIGSAIALASSRPFRACDLVHANTSRAALYAGIACWLTRKPLVVHLRDRVEDDAIGHFGAWLLRGLCARAQGVIANSKATLGTVEEALSMKTRTYVLRSHIGIKCADVSYPTPSDLARDGTRLRVGMVARLDPWKGQELLLEAIALAHDTSRVDMDVVLVGGGAFDLPAQSEHLIELATSLGLRDRLVMTGHVSDVTEWIDQFDICVQASLRPEPMGQNVLQYLVRGRVVVVANEGGPAELVSDRETGIHFKARDPHDLACELVRLATDTQLRAKLAAAALERGQILSDQGLADSYAAAFEAFAERSDECA